jgi:uncharacterized RDD family membrane protein YckC
MAESNDFLTAHYNIDTPENVTFGYELAGIGSRFIGALLDTAIIAVALLLLNLVLLVLLYSAGDLANLGSGGLSENGFSTVGGLILAVYALLNFVIFWGYYVLFEWRWNGQTPGKRVAKIRVVRTDGNPPGILEIVLRNVVRIVDFLPSGYALGLVVMFFNKQARRLGDYVAGTLVVKERRDVTLHSLEDQASRPAPTEMADNAVVPYPDARRLSLSDYNLICDALARYAQHKLDAAIVQRLATAIAAKMAAPAPTADTYYQFLTDVVKSYRGTRT